MPGAGSSFDKNDFRAIEQLTRQIKRVGDELERLNDNLEGDEKDE